MLFVAWAESGGSVAGSGSTPVELLERLSLWDAGRCGRRRCGDCAISHNGFFVNALDIAKDRSRIQVLLDDVGAAGLAPSFATCSILLKSSTPLLNFRH